MSSFQPTRAPVEPAIDSRTAALSGATRQSRWSARSVSKRPSAFGSWRRTSEPALLKRESRVQPRRLPLDEVRPLVGRSRPGVRPPGGIPCPGGPRRVASGPQEEGDEQAPIRRSTVGEASTLVRKDQGELVRDGLGVRLGQAGIGDRPGRGVLAPTDLAEPPDILPVLPDPDRRPGASDVGGGSGRGRTGTTAGSRPPRPRGGRRGPRGSRRRPRRGSSCPRAGNLGLPPAEEAIAETIGRGPRVPVVRVEVEAFEHRTIGIPPRDPAPSGRVR